MFIAFAVLATVLWPISYGVSGHTTVGEVSWWSATTVTAWLGAAGASVGAAISGMIRLSMHPPIRYDSLSDARISASDFSATVSASGVDASADLG